MLVTDLRALLVGGVTLALTVGFVVDVLSGSEFNPTVLTAIGVSDPAIREYAEAKLDEVILRPELGHDGRFFFVQANDPWLTNPSENAAVLDRPTYRSQRMLYPIFASAAGLAGPEEIVWGMIIVNVVAMAVGASATSALALWMGGSAWWGLAFPLNIGLISEFSIGGAGILAAACAFWAVLMLCDERWYAGGILLAASALSREAMLIVAVGAFLWIWTREQPKDAIKVGGIPLLAVLGWAVFLRLRLPEDTDLVAGNLGLPFLGLSENVSNWLGDPLEFAVGLMTIGILAVLVHRAYATPSLLAWSFALFAPLAILLTTPVWDGFFNISRAVAPVYTAFVLVVFADRRTQAHALSDSDP